ncbi:zinc finger MYND domain-containing protein 12 [Ambystoma mexicanum]|uniref:zinc finger MYND domain-containing protein 12 n=1 Tax=Ambystoma mexicanum TaxID=8296 RepID=UPI0037E7D21C
MVSVYPLANPKGVRLLCELCQSPAFLQCPDCRVTYYCTPEHQLSDRESVHPALCHLLGPLRAPPPALCSDEERRRNTEQTAQLRRHLLQLCLEAAERHLGAGMPSQSLPAAMHSLRFSIALHGLRSSQLVPPYLLLAEASIRLGHLTQAEEYLGQARWTLLKNPDCSLGLLAKLHRNQGLLFSARGNLAEALAHLANDVYYNTCLYGTGNVHASPGCFHMANVFLRQKKAGIAESLYTEITDSWHAQLSRMLRRQLSAAQDQRASGPEDECLDKGLATEAVQILTEISEIRQGAPKREPGKLVRNLHAKAMLHLVLGDAARACELARKALLMAKDLPHQDEAGAIQAFLTMAESKLPICE